MYAVYLLMWCSFKGSLFFDTVCSEHETETQTERHSVIMYYTLHG